MFLWGDFNSSGHAFRGGKNSRNIARRGNAFLPNLAVLTEIIRYAVKSNHRPFELRVDAKAIKNGFYADLYSLQGEKRTWWTGAAVSQIEFLESSVCSDLIILWERVVSTY
jgi:hypothetical protein